MQGKLVHGITQLGIKHQKPVIAICGTLDITQEEMKQLNLVAAFSIINKPMTLEEASRDAYKLTSDTAYQIGRLYESWKGKEMN